MSAQPHASLGYGLGIGFVLAIGGAAVLAALAPWLGFAAATRTVIAALGFAYLLYVMGASGERVGRVTTLALWAATTALIAAAGWPLAVYALAHVALVWLVRSLYHYSGLLPALADFGLALLGAAFAAWAAQRSGSAWLAFWCFFLVQSLHVLIPSSLGGSPRDASDGGGGDAFARAHRAAESALRRLSSAR